MKKKIVLVKKGRLKAYYSGSGSWVQVGERPNRNKDWCIEQITKNPSKLDEQLQKLDGRRVRIVLEVI